MTSSITASFDTLLKQGPMTAGDSLDEIVKILDGKFGKGYAERNPQLVGQLTQASVHDIGLAILAQQIRAGLESVSEAISTANHLSELTANIPDVIKDGFTELAESIAGRGTLTESIDALAESLKGAGV